jgi:hypothetical protein
MVCQDLAGVGVMYEHYANARHRKIFINDSPFASFLQLPLLLVIELTLLHSKEDLRMI